MRAAFGIALLTVMLLAGCRERIGSGWDWNRMREQPRTDRYGASAALPDSMVLQLPPAGTVAATDTSAASAPIDIQRGAARWGIYCAVCHGEHADGQSVMASNMMPPHPPSLTTGPGATPDDTRLDSVIVHGFGRMPGFGTDIPRADRRAIVAYIDSLRRAAVGGH